MKASFTPHAKIELARASIATLQTERKTIEEQARSRSDVEAYAAAYVADLVQKARREAHLFLVRCAAGGHAHAYGTDLATILPPAVNPGALLAFLTADIGLVATGLEPAAKAKRLAEIEQALCNLEVIEEAEINAVELATGEYIPRRPDARPEIVLALTSEV